VSLPDDLASTALTLARRFSAGATLWSVSPRWPSHGRHIAVEFVHPVIVGKRALPALYVDDLDPTGALRLLHRPGDVVIAVGTADDARVASLMRRAPAWGLTSIWIGAGTRAAAGSADHVLWLDEPAPPEVLASSGAFVLLYHLLWELTHVVYEHPGLLTTAVAGDCDDDVCITCSDEGRLGEVVRPLDGSRALVIADGRSETIDTTLVDPLAPGDLVLVHAGTAITVITEEDER
jgi:hypothetical protein